MNNHLQLSRAHNGPEFRNVPQLVERGVNQIINMLVDTQSPVHGKRRDY